MRERDQDRFDHVTFLTQCSTSTKEGENSTLNLHPPIEESKSIESLIAMYPEPFPSLPIHIRPPARFC